MTAKKHTKTTPRESSQRRQLSESGLSLTELAKSGLTREEAKRLAMHPQPRTPEEREELRCRRAAAPAADARTTAGSTTARRDRGAHDRAIDRWQLLLISEEQREAEELAGEPRQAATGAVEELAGL